MFICIAKLHKQVGTGGRERVSSGSMQHFPWLGLVCGIKINPLLWPCSPPTTPTQRLQPYHLHPFHPGRRLCVHFGTRCHHAPGPVPAAVCRWLVGPYIYGGCTEGTYVFTPPPASRMFPVTGFTALSAFMGAFSATRLATAELIQKAMPYTKSKEMTTWPLLLCCRPLMQARPT